MSVENQGRKTAGGTGQRAEQPDPAGGGAGGKRKKMSLMTKILIGMGLGVVLGIVMGEAAVTWLQPLGTLFMRMLKMLVLPLVFSCIVSAIASLDDIKSLASMGARSFVTFVVMVLLAIATGIVFGNLTQPGVNAGIQLPAADVEATDVNFIDTIIAFVPENVFESLSGNNMIQVVVFAFFMGVCVLLAGKKGEPVKAFFSSMADVMGKMVDIVIGFAPVGVCGMMAGIVGQYGIASLIPLGKFLIWFHVAVVFYIFVICGIYVRAFCKMGLLKFFKALGKTLVMTYATDSSAAAMPLAIKELQENLGVDETTATFVMSIGTNISKAGSALYQGMVAIFIAQIVGMRLNFAQQGLVMFMALVSTMSLAGIPSASLVMLTLTLGCVDLPLEGIALMSGIDRILGGARTLPNVIVNCGVAKMLQAQGVGEPAEGEAKQEGELA